MNTANDRMPMETSTVRTDTGTTPAARRRTPVLRSAVAGGFAGVIAGCAVLAAAVLYSWLATPEEAWLPMKNVAATWLGVDALIGGAWTVVIVVATHFGNSIAWGIVFGLLMSRPSRRPNVGVTVVAGFIWGMVVWVVMTWLTLPGIDPTMAARVAVQPVWWWWVLHAIYGVVLGAALAVMGAPFLQGNGAVERGM